MSQVAIPIKTEKADGGFLSDFINAPVQHGYHMASSASALVGSLI